jgi:hypothetical protein
MDDVMNVSGELFRQPLEEKKLKFSNLIEGKRFQLEGYGDDAVTSQDQILGWKTSGAGRRVESCLLARTS